MSFNNMPFKTLSQATPLFRRVTVAQWCVLAVTIVLETLALIFMQTPFPTLRIDLCLAALAGLAVLSVFRCEERAYPIRVTVILFELGLIQLASVSGVSRWTWPLYLVLVARAALLLKRNHMWWLIGFAYFAQLGMYGLRFLDGVPAVERMAAAASALASAVILTSSYGALMILVALLMLAMLSEQQLRKKTELLAAQNEHLAQELERTRIARELHDTLGHSLTSLKIQLELAGRLMDIDEVKARAALAQAETLAGRSLTDTRVALQSIRNSDFDFGKALQSLVSEVSANGMKVHLDIVEQPLPNAASYQLYRVLQECLTNAVKHAGCTEVFVDLRRLDESVELTIKDNGRGFVQIGTADGFGLKGIRERINSLSGSVNIESAPQEGTVVMVRVPIALID